MEPSTPSAVVEVTQSNAAASEATAPSLAGDTPVSTPPATGRPGADTDDAPDRDDPAQGFIVRFFERIGRRYGLTHLLQLVKNRGGIRRTFQGLPDRMHKLANQTQLVLELADDYRAGVYRAIPWRSILVLIGVVAYLLSPIDLIPDLLSAIGVLDDMLLIALANRLMRRDLEAYCQFKGYPIEEYF